MKKRRDNHTGTLIQRPDGKILAQIRIRGKRYSKVLPDRGEALDWLAQMRARHLKGELPPSAISFSHAVQEWLTYKKKSLRPRTLHDYQSLLARVDSYWHDRPIEGITPRDVRRLLQDIDNQMAKTENNASGWASRTVYTYKVLNMLFKYLAVEGFISTNPVAKVPRPKHTAREPKILNAQDLRKLLQIEGFEDQIGRAIFIAFAFALRRGEVLGLRWQDIDFEREQVHITKQAFALKGKMHLADLKTSSSNRTIPLHPQAKAVLLEQRAFVETLKAFAGKRWQENDLVFPSKTGTLWDSSQFSKAFRRRREKLGLSLRFHDIRHTAASWMVAQKGITAAQKLLGHAQSTTTLLYYTHSIEPPESSLSLLDESFFQHHPGGAPTPQTPPQSALETSHEAI